ncbi:MAG: 3-phosphoshikimate 1-carboxyvinyltransferase 1 [Gemmatimonadaceae bacterium]|nr:3-phosphoshikimate 1-carboxyvinyltransferase 1 [Gemmatimonadaceae bacterium]
MPGDKSISHRALMLAAVANGSSRLEGLLCGEDVQSTARVLRSCGVAIPSLQRQIVVPGCLPFRSPEHALDCGNSGTTARLMAGLLAGQPVEATLTGDESLSRRPMRRVAEPLRRMGAGIEFPAGGDTLPMRVRGAALRGHEFELATASAQVKSAVLLAALVGRVSVRVREPSASRDHTERMLRAIGCGVEEGPNGIDFTPVDRLQPLDLDVPGDPSSAAFMVALGCLASEGSLRVSGISLNPTRTTFIDVLRRMGGDVATRPGRSQLEPIGDVIATASAGLRGTTVAGSEVPGLIDEIPLLACLAARAEGESIFRDARELRIKESDRIAATVANLRAIGVDADELDDGLVVVGSDRPLRGRIATHDDHRIAMAFGILGALPGNAIEIDRPTCVAISYPDYWSDLARVTA